MVSVEPVKSPLAWGRGLKPLLAYQKVYCDLSPLARGRGLKREAASGERRGHRRPSCGGVD